MKRVQTYFLCAALMLRFSLASAADVSVYADALTPEWQNWSWSSTVNLANASPVHSGTRSMSIKYNAAWAALYLHATVAYSTTEYNQIRFWIHGGNTGNQRVALVANGDTSHAYSVTAPANVWTQITVPFMLLGNPATVTDLYWQDATGTAQPLFYLDGIQLLASNAPPPPPPILNVDASVVRHVISDNIYGMNFAEEPLASELRLPVRRWGGNSTTRYNWKTSMTNTANDWYYETLPEGTVDVANLPNGSSSDQFVEQNRRTGTRTILTIPLIGWTAKLSSPRSHPYDCAFKVSRYGPQQAVDPWDSDCGNGIRSDGSLIGGNDPKETSDSIDANFVKDWINHLVGRYGSAANQGVEFYNLDNEPMLWNSTHRDIHPQPVSYDELRDRTFTYAAAIKDADPSAKTLGPVLWGWCAYLYSAKDGCSPGADYLGHGSQQLIPWYLSQMRSYEQSTSRRILDYLDLHYYPQANGVSLALAGSANTQSLRLRSTRSLWDPTYIEESWISDTEAGGVKINLIPRMREWVNTYYPGTRLAITEYNWGGLEDINGALAQADVLGIFGRENLDLATLWSAPALGQPGAFAFRMYRNYDAQGNGFGNQNVAAVSSNQDALAIYAAKRSKDNALTVMVINKTSGALTSPLNIAGASLPATAAVYRYSKTNLGVIVKLPDQTMTSTGFSAEFPANSITLFVASQSTANQAALTVTATPGTVTSGGEGSQLGTTGGSTGGAVTYSVVPSSGVTCTINGTTLTANGGSGTCSVTATMAGNANYEPVTSAVLEVPVTPSTAVSRLEGISTRGQVGTGDNVLIGGFIIEGTEPRQVLIRAIGPSMSSAGVPDILQNPQISLMTVGGSLVASNDDWQSNANAGDISARGLAPTDTREAALLMTLQPNTPYTPIVSGVGGSTGVGLVEVYDVGGSNTGSRLKGISTRGQVGSGAQQLIGGFIISGAEPKQVLIRAIGPSMSSAGVSGTLANPRISLTTVTGTPVANNDDWQTNANAGDISAKGLAPSNPLESALLITLQPNTPYTPIVSGVGGANGVGLVEVYEVVEP